MDATAMLEYLRYEQVNILKWMSHANQQGIHTSDGHMVTALSGVSNLMRLLVMNQPVNLVTFLQVTSDSENAVFAYWDELHEREYQDRIWTAYLKTREWVNGLRRKGLVEKDMDDNYDLTDAGRDYFSVGGEAA